MVSHKEESTSKSFGIISFLPFFKSHRPTSHFLRLNLPSFKGICNDITENVFNQDFYVLSIKNGIRGKCQYSISKVQRIAHLVSWRLWLPSSGQKLRN